MYSLLVHKHNWQIKFVLPLQLLCKSIVFLSLLAAVADARLPPAWGSLEFHATPIAHPKLTKSLLSLVSECHENQQLHVGIHAAIKALEKEPASEFVVFGADSDCDSLIEEVIEIAQNKCVPYVFVPSCEDLGKCCWSVYDERFENLFGVTIVSKNDSLINDKIASAKAEIKELVNHKLT